MSGNKELIDALNEIEKEKDISKDVLLEAIENSLLAACKNQFGRTDNIKVNINRENGAVNVYAEKTIVDEVEDDLMEITLEEVPQKETGSRRRSKYRGYPQELLKNLCTEG